MIKTPGIRSLEAIQDLGEVSSQGLKDVFSQKVGEWAFATTTPSTHNVQPDIPSRFAQVPVDGTVMDYLESYLGECKTLPVGHLYDGALEQVAQKVINPEVKALLEADLQLRSFLRERRIGEVYE